MEILHHIKEDELINEIRNGEKSLLRLFYLKEKKNFLEWSTKHFGISSKKAIRLYKRSILELYEIVAFRKINKVDFVLKDALYSIASYLMKTDQAFKIEITEKDDNQTELIKQLQQFINKSNGYSDEVDDKIRAIWNSLDTTEKSIVKLLYYDNIEPDKIAETLGLEGTDKVMKIKETVISRFLQTI